MAVMAHLEARVPLISANSKGPVVNLVAWITTVISCLAVLTVLFSRVIVLRKLGWGDSVVLSALVRSDHTIPS